MSNLGSASLWDLDEGRNATASMEMLEAGDYVVPTFNTQLRVDKPALLYWLQIASYNCFGKNEFSARWPSALAALAMLVVCYELGRALFSASTGLLAAVILASTAMTVGAARFANPDALLCLFVSAALALFWRGHARPSSRWYISLGALLGLACLTKGPVGVVLPALVIFTYLLWDKRLALALDPRALHVFTTLLIVALPWYLWVTVVTRGEFLEGFLWEHHLRRFFYPLERHTGSPFYYVMVLLIGTLPWSIFVFVATWYGGWSMTRTPWFGVAWWRQAADKSAGAGGADLVSSYRFLGAWLGCYLVFFTLSATKLPNYLLPAALPFSLLSARFLDRWRVGDIGPARWVIGTCLAGLGGTGMLAVIGLAVVGDKFPFISYPGPAVRGLEYHALLGLVPIGASLAGYWAWRRGRPHGVLAALIVGAVLFMAPAAVWTLPAWNQVKAAAPLVERAGACNRLDDIRIGAYKLEYLPSLNFYCGRDLTHYTSQVEALAFLRYPVTVYLFMPAPLWDELKALAPPGARLLGRHPDMYRSSDIVVVANRPGDPAP